MPLFITRRPEKNLTGTWVRWTAAHNPYIFEATRKDVVAFNTAIRPSYHPALPTIRTNLIPAFAPIFANIGDTIYVNSGIYKGNYTIAAVNGEYITIDTPYIGIGGSGWVNFVDVITAHKTIFKVYNVITGALVGNLVGKGDSTGLVLFDISGLLKSLMRNRDSCAFINNNEPNPYTSGAIRIGWYTSTIVLGDFTQTAEVDDGIPYYWVSGAKQVDGRTLQGIAGYGQNMADYTPTRQAGYDSKFLTMFEKPTMWVGYPFSLSFIYNKDFESHTLKRHQQNYNINRAATSAQTSVSLAPNGAGYVNDLKLNSLDATTKEVDVWLETDGVPVSGGGGLLVNGGMVRDFSRVNATLSDQLETVTIINISSS